MKLHSNYTHNEFDFLNNNLLELSEKCLTELKHNMSLEEELDIIDKVNYILKNLELIELGKQNLKTYKDDKGTVSNIKEVLNYYGETIKKVWKI